MADPPARHGTAALATAAGDGQLPAHYGPPNVLPALAAQQITAVLDRE